MPALFFTKDGKIQAGFFQNMDDGWNHQKSIDQMKGDGDNGGKKNNKPGIEGNRHYNRFNCNMDMHLHQNQKAKM